MQALVSESTTMPSRRLDYASEVLRMLKEFISSDMMAREGV